MKHTTVSMDAIEQFDILKPILDIYDEKLSILLFYLQPEIQVQVCECQYLDDDNELFLNDKVFAIRRSDLQLDCIGCIHGIKPNRLTLRKTTGSMVHLQTEQYHILFKRKRSKQNDREFYQALLNSL